MIFNGFSIKWSEEDRCFVAKHKFCESLMVHGYSVEEVKQEIGNLLKDIKK